MFNNYVPPDLLYYSKLSHEAEVLIKCIHTASVLSPELKKAAQRLETIGNEIAKLDVSDPDKRMHFINFIEARDALKDHSGEEGIKYKIVHHLIEHFWQACYPLFEETPLAIDFKNGTKRFTPTPT